MLAFKAGSQGSAGAGVYGVGGVEQPKRGVVSCGGSNVLELALAACRKARVYILGRQVAVELSTTAIEVWMASTTWIAENVMVEWAIETM